MNQITQKEPVAVGYAVALIVNALLTGLSVWGVADLTADQTAWVYMAVNAILFVVIAIKTRSVVWSPYTIANDPGLPPLPGTQPGPTPQGN